MMIESGFPPGYLGDGPECGYAIAVHAHIDKVACTSPVEIKTFTNKTKKKMDVKCLIEECGSERVDNKDYFIKATIFSDVKDDMQITREEIFDSAISLLKYDSYEGVIKRANDTAFGLGAGVITRDIRRGLTLAHQIRPGSIWINTYKTICDQALFDGFNESGQERELGRYGLEPYYQSDPDKAIEAAEKGFQCDSPWRKSDPAARAQLICKLADLLLHVVGYLAVKMFTLVELAKKRIVGDPFDLTTEQGPYV
ncbi:unnamed protein product [Rotaria sordida]|uniref:Aldehyde dehydrogenase domain-containing protein n=1 Tax=Rotaria sordida TaxID=392033 RepID=A0A814Q5V8_9BILA|nr:unnamed protein product [Rotaria sordida]CAF1572513.1 unnamed protein product [Rotaria sordida]